MLNKKAISLISIIFSIVTVCVLFFLGFASTSFCPSGVGLGANLFCISPPTMYFLGLSTLVVSAILIRNKKFIILISLLIIFWSLFISMAKYREYAYKQKVIQNISDFEVYLPGSDFINTQLYFHESRLRMFYYPKNSNPSDVLIEEGKNKSNFDPNTGCVTPNSINYQVQCSVMATPKGNQIYWDAVGSSGVYADGTPTKGYNAYVIKNGTTIFIQYTYFSTNINPENDLIKLVDSLTRIESEKVNPTYNCWRYFDPFCQDHSPAEMW